SGGRIPRSRLPLKIIDLHHDTIGWIPEILVGRLPPRDGPDNRSGTTVNRFRVDDGEAPRAPLRLRITHRARSRGSRLDRSEAVRHKDEPPARDRFGI